MAAVARAHSGPADRNGVSSTEKEDVEMSERANILTDLNLTSGAADSTPKSKANPNYAVVIHKHKGYSRRTGVCYDTRMQYHAQTTQTDKIEGDHPENYMRIIGIYRELIAAGLLEDTSLDFSTYDKIPQLHWQLPKKMDRAPHDKLIRIHAREATRDEVIAVHTEEHWDRMAATSFAEDHDLEQMTSQGDSVYFNRSTFKSAKLAAGGAIETCGHVSDGRVRNAFAIVRPPGHHAEPACSMGFCHFNNVSVAARAIQKENKSIKKIMILDWDVHHGNGTQTAFYDDPSVLYMSIHRYDNGTFYPPGDNGSADKCGSKEAIGRNVNIPWPCGGMADGDYLHIFNELVIPIGREFSPDLVIISAGFDAADGDPIGDCHVSPTGYAHMTHMMMSLARGKVFVCLEGGYNIESISRSALAVTQTLMGDPLPSLDPVNVEISIEARRTVAIVKKYQYPYWKCLDSPLINRELKKRQYMISMDSRKGVIRGFQARTLNNKYNMAELPLFSDDLNVVFQDQILVTPDLLHSAKNLLILAHDSPELRLGEVVAGPREINPFTCMVQDEAMRYLEWAIGKGYGVLDVNIPNFGVSYGEAATDQAMIEQLALYIWDNYIEYHETMERVVLVGVGTAMHFVHAILGRRRFNKRVKGIMTFSGHESPVRSYTSRELLDEQQKMVNWFYENSMVYISTDNDVVPVNQRSTRKWGNVRRVQEKYTQDVLHSSFTEATNWLEKKFSG